MRAEAVACSVEAVACSVAAYTGAISIELYMASADSAAGNTRHRLLYTEP